MKCFRLMKRYPISGGYLIFILFIVYLIMFDILGSYNREQQWQEDAKKYQYPYKYTMTAFSFPKDQVAAFIEECQDVKDVCITVEEIWVSATKEAGKFGYADALISNAVGGLYPMKEGNLPEANADPPQIAVGVEYTKDIVHKNGASYFELDGKEYRVSGLIESPYSDYMNKKIVLNYSDLSSTRQEKIGENFSFAVQSQSAPDDALNELYRILKRLNADTHIQAYRETENNSQPLGSDGEERRIQWILIGCCALVLALVADFWIEDRNREIAVKKTFGHGTFRILGMLLSELLEFMTISFILYSAFWGVRVMCGIEKQLFLLQKDMYNLWMILFLLLLLLTAGVLVPAIRILRCQPADILKKE